MARTTPFPSWLTYASICLVNLSASEMASASESFVTENAKDFAAVAVHITATITSPNGGSHLLSQLLARV